ncbi:hypothetical protein N2152v2_005837 [Parachlorella kessleri]
MAALSDLEAPLLRTAVDVKDSSSPSDHCAANDESALALPADYARLGPGVATGALAVCTLGVWYSGLLFARLATAFPRVEVFDQFGKAAFGRAGQRLVFATIYACILITPVIFQITCTESLLTILGPGRLSPLAVHGVVLAIMLPLAQVRQLEEVGWLSLAGTLSMVASVLIVLLKIVMLPANGLPLAAAAEPSPGSGTSLRMGLVAFMDVVFAYGGAANWMRYISGMRRRSDFRKVAGVGAVFMTACYLALGAVGYLKLGSNFDLSRPITSVLPYDAWSVTMNGLLFLHCVVAYAININVWTDLVLHLLAAAHGVPTSHQDSSSHRGSWAATSCIGLAFCFLVAYTFPYFTIVVALISSVGDLAAAYALPALFSLKLLKLPAWERCLCWALVPLAFGLSGVGMYSSLHELIAKMLGWD